MKIRSRRLFGIVVITAVFSVQFAAAETDWTGWRGPNRDGYAKSFQPPAAWPKQLRSLWQAEVGTGYATPLISRDRVFQHARQGENEVVLCLELETGKEVWRQSYPVPFKMGGGGERHGKGPKSCPVLSDGRLFTMSITGVLSAWEMESGKLLWRRDFSDRFKKGHPYWGVSTSPIVDNDRVIAHFGTDDDGSLLALDVASGQEIWAHGKDGPDYSSPLLATIDGVRQLIEWNQRALIGVESKTGRLLWEYPFPHIGTNQNMPTPVFHQGRIYLGGENRGIFALQPVKQGGSWSVEELWHQDKVALDMSTAVAAGDSLYGFSHYGSGRLFCLDLKSGEIQWQGPGRVGQNVMFLSVRDHIVALIDNGRLKVIRQNSDRLDEVASYQVADGGTWAPPVMLNHRILTKDKQTLTMWAFD